MRIRAFLIFSIVAVATMCSCNRISQDDLSQTAQPRVATALDSSETQGSTMNHQPDSNAAAPSARQTLAEETKFYWMSKRSEDKAAYETAAQYIAELPQNAELEPTSLRFAHWFILFYSERSDGDGIEVLDQSPKRWAYLVDSDRKKCIGKGDFEDARPLLERLVDVAQTLEGQKRSLFVERMASVVVAIADQSQDNVSSVDGAPNGGEPELSTGAEKTTLRFYCRKPGGAYHIDLAQLFMTPSSMSFERIDADLGE